MTTITRSWDTPGAIVLGATVTTLLVVGTLLSRSYRQRKQRLQSQRPRSFSYTSTAMALGSFPPSVKVPEPIINAALMFQECPKPEELVEQIVPQLLEYERLATIPEPKLGKCRYPASELDLHRLVRHIVIDGNEQLTVDTMQAHLFDSLEARDELPWWELLVIENKGSGKSACVLRIHHCLADGVSVLGVIEDILFHVDGSPVRSIIPDGIRKKFKLGLPFYKVLFRSMVSAFRVLSLPITPFDDDTVFSRCANKDMVHSGKRSIVMLPPVELDFIKKLKNAASATVNDILFTCLSQTIHDYLVEQKCTVLKDRGTQLQCRTLIPAAAISQPPEAANDKSRALRNKWVLVSANLQVGEEDVVDRLKAAHEHLLAIKNSLLVPVQMWIQNYITPYLPISVGRQAVFDIFCRHSLVFTNIPGPSSPVVFAGKEIKEMQVFYANLISQASFMSYREKIFGNFCLDADEIADSQSLSRLYANSLLKLAKRLDVPVPESTLKN